MAQTSWKELQERESRDLALWEEKKEQVQRFNLGQYPNFVDDYRQSIAYQGYLYPLGINQSAQAWSKTEEISSTLPNYMQAIKKSPPAFAAEYVRATVLSQARFIWRNRRDRHTFPNNDLALLEHPWVNGTTGELLSRMEWHAGLAGNAYVYRQSATRLRVLRPDWVAIIYGSDSDPEDPKGALDVEVVGYAYKNGGFSQNNKAAITIILPEQLAHWTPLPDPMSPGLGMSWLTPVLRDIQVDQLIEEYKLAFFANGATPNLVIKGIPSPTMSQFVEFVDKMEAAHKGTLNAWKTLYLQTGADATVIGSNMQNLALNDLRSTGEERISYLSRVPAAILGIAAGLKGSSLNAGNYSETRRTFADTWYYATLADCCAALSAIVDVPGGAELWYDATDVPMLREDALAAIQIELAKQQAIVAYVQAGFKPESVLTAVNAQDITELEYDERFISVQLQSLTNAKTQDANGPEADPDATGDAADATPTNGAIPATNGNSNGQPKPADTTVVATPGGK